MNGPETPVSWREVADERGLPAGGRRPRAHVAVSRPSEDPALLLPPSGLTSTRQQHHHASALAAACRATDAEGFGKALRLLLEKSNFRQSDVLVHRANHAQLLKKSTVSRMVNGTTLPRRAEHIEVFVAACGADADIPAWVDAWRDVRRRAYATTVSVAESVALKTQAADVNLHIRVIASGEVVVGVHETTGQCVVCVSEKPQ